MIRVKITRTVGGVASVTTSTIRGESTGREEEELARMLEVRGLPSARWAKTRDGVFSAQTRHQVDGDVEDAGGSVVVNWAVEVTQQVQPAPVAMTALPVKG